jgi:hypothetical protein
MAGDPNYSNVSLLLHCDGTNGSTTFTDNSPSPKTVTANGNAQISTAQSVYGGASGLFDGSGDYLTVADAAAFEFGSGDFTIEARIRLTAYPASNGGLYEASIVSKDVVGSRGFTFNLNGTVNSYTGISFLGFSGNTTYASVSATTGFSLNTWYTVSVVRSGNLVYLFKDGVLLNAGGTAFSLTIQDTSTTVKIGAENFDSTYLYPYPGYIDEVRITKGVGRYTADYTPATEAFPNVKYALVGAETVSLTPSSTMAYYSKKIVGSVPITAAPSSTMAYHLRHVLNGMSSVAITPSATMTYYPRNIILGSTTLSVSPAAAMTYYPRNIILGSTTLSVAPSSVMHKPLTYSVTGAIPIAVTPASTMIKPVRYPIIGSSLVSVTPYSDYGFNRNRLFCEMAMNFAADGYQEIPNTLTVEMPLPAFEAFGGGELAVEMVPDFAASGYAEVDGVLSVDMPMSFAFSGYTSVMGDLAVTMGFAFEAEGGGELAVLMPAFTFEASSVVGSVGEMTVLMPRFTFAAEGHSYTSIGTLNIEMPILVANYGAMYVSMAMGFGAWTAPVQNSLVTYAMNVKTAETTTYSNFDFKYIMRLGYDYYGVRDDGLYLLGGATDNGALIEASFRTAQNMYGTNLRKRSPKIYLDTENTTSILPIVDTEEGEYVYESEFGGRKVSLGRGYEGKIWEFELANVDGEAWRIGAMEIQLDVLSRRI